MGVVVPDATPYYGSGRALVDFGLQHRQWPSGALQGPAAAAVQSELRYFAAVVEEEL